jgi:hypothetical protein
MRSFCLISLSIFASVPSSLLAADEEVCEAIFTEANTRLGRPLAQVESPKPAGNSMQVFLFRRATTVTKDGKPYRFLDLTPRTYLRLKYDAKTRMLSSIEVIPPPAPPPAPAPVKELNYGMLKVGDEGKLPDNGSLLLKTAKILSDTEVILRLFYSQETFNAKGQRTGFGKQQEARPFILRGSSTKTLADDVIFPDPGQLRVAETKRLEDGRTLFVLTPLPAKKPEEKPRP